MKDHRIAIRPRVSLDPAVKKLVLEAFNSAIEDIDQDDETYVEKKLAKKVGLLRSSDAQWQRTMAAVAEAMFHSCYPTKTADQDLTMPLHLTIVAALFYLCNPWDIIPDHDMTNGLVDDALVINECMKRIKGAAPGMYQRIVVRVEETSI